MTADTSEVQKSNLVPITLTWPDGVVEKIEVRKGLIDHIRAVATTENITLNAAFNMIMRRALELYRKPA